MTAQAPFGNSPSKVQRYQAFWNRDSVDRPMVGFSFKTWLPMLEYSASAQWQTTAYLTPEMVEPEAFMDDQERLLREGERIDDDILRGASPTEAVPWLQGTLGHKLRILPGSILGEGRRLAWEELKDVHLDHESTWFKKYIEFIQALVKRAGGRFPVSHGTLDGPSDMTAGFRGHDRFIFDLIDEPARASRLLRQCGDIFREITEEVWRHIPLFCGGYYDAQYQLWAPGPIARLQEDATGIYSPEFYRRFLQPIDRELAGHFAYGFMHLHSTSMFLLDAFLEVETIRCFEINYDVSGPPLEDMIPYYRMVQEADRPLLVRGSFTPDEARLLMDSLEPCGLYLYIMVESQEEIEALRPPLGM